MKSRTLILLVLLAICFYSFKTIQHNAKCPDLTVVKFNAPEWDHENQRTFITVEIQNTGNEISKACRAKVYDLDVTLEQAIEWKLDTLYFEMILENISRSDSTNVDNDLYVEAFTQIPELKPGKKTKLTFYIYEHWVYDPNCEMEVLLDFENIIEECDEENNRKHFFGWG